MGSEPIEEEIPVELDDLPDDIQSIVLLYNNLQDTYEYTAGNYIGKNLINVPQLLELYSIDESLHVLAYEIINLLDNLKSKHLASLKPKK